MYGIVCFEMKAAGTMNHFPCVVVREVSNYADEWKDDVWVRYAALAAGAYVKELLGYLPVEALENEVMVKLTL